MSEAEYSAAAKEAGIAVITVASLLSDEQKIETNAIITISEVTLAKYFDLMI